MELGFGCKMLAHHTPNTVINTYTHVLMQDACTVHTNTDSNTYKCAHAKMFARMGIKGLLYCRPTALYFAHRHARIHTDTHTHAYTHRGVVSLEIVVVTASADVHSGGY